MSDDEIRGVIDSLEWNIDRGRTLTPHEMRVLVKLLRNVIENDAGRTHEGPWERSNAR